MDNKSGFEEEDYSNTEEVGERELVLVFKAVTVNMKMWRAAGVSVYSTQKYLVSVCFVLGPATNRSVKEFAEELSLWTSTFI